MVRKVAELHVERREALAEIIVREMGKPMEQALGEVDFCGDIYGFYADNAEEFLADEPIELLAGEGTAIIRRTSMGPLIGIMPWNFPYYQVARFAGPNLIVGNTILLKPAPQCPESAAAIQQIYDEAGFPEGAYQTILATNDQIADVDRRPAGPRCLADRLRARRRRGRRDRRAQPEEGRARARRLGPVHPARHRRPRRRGRGGGRARLDNTGQSCNAAKRFIVADELYDDFLEKFTAEMTAAEPGDPTSEDTAIGPLSSSAAAERLQEQLDRAVDAGRRGRRRAASGTATSSRRTVLTGITTDNDAYHEEFFGPVASVYKVGSEEEAVELANDTPFGLGSYVFSNDPEQAAARRRRARHGHGLRQRRRRSTARSCRSAASSAPASAASSAPSASRSSSTRS